MLKQLMTFAFCFFSFLLSAQDNWDHIQVVDESDIVDSIVVGLHDSPEFSQKQLERAIPSLKQDYTGYAIELLVSDHELSVNNSAFGGFGRIYMEQTTSNQYRYLVLIDFRRRRSVKQFYRKIIKPKSPNSKVVQYLKGVRTTEFSWY